MHGRRTSLVSHNFFGVREDLFCFAFYFGIESHSKNIAKQAESTCRVWRKSIELLDKLLTVPFKDGMQNFCGMLKRQPLIDWL